MSDSVKCVLLPLAKERYLVLPNSSLAEVVTHRSDLLVMGARGGVIGKIQWRGHSVPLVSYEAAIGHVIPSYGSGTRIAVIFAPSGDPDLPYIAFSIQGVPRLSQISDTDIVTVEGEEHQLVASYVEIGEKQCFIPDLQELESFVKLRASNCGPLFQVASKVLE